ncbi:hypothetical protein NB693_21275 [Pantoea ananatis]|nr:hypothetical protein [Pantoea ananatis]
MQQCDASVCCDKQQALPSQLSLRGTEDEITATDERDGDAEDRGNAIRHASGMHVQHLHVEAQYAVMDGGSHQTVDQVAEQLPGQLRLSGSGHATHPR